MIQHPMPVLTEQQRNAISNWLSIRIKSLNEKAESQEGGLTTGQFFQRTSYEITLAALTAEPHAWHRMPDQGFHLPMVLRKEQGPPALEGEFYPVYDVLPVPVIKAIENDGVGK